MSTRPPVDSERLRRDLIDYFGTAMTGDLWLAIADLSEVEDASPERLIEIAEEAGFDLARYGAVLHE